MRASVCGSLSMVAAASLIAFAPARPLAVQPPPDATAPRVLVTGEVRYPGRATLTDTTLTILDALAAVGSPTANAGDEVVVIRAGEAGGAPLRITLALKDLDLGIAAADPVLRDGDIVNVPAAKRFFVSGLVKRPGAYKLHQGLTVAQAIALVGGLTDGGNVRRLRIVRLVNGKMVEMPAALGDRILPDDELKVPRSMF